MHLQNEADAVAELQSLAAADYDPKLSQADLQRILRGYRRCSVRASGMAVFYGQRVVPARGNGRSYRCVVDGQTGETEPAWPRGRGGAVSDGEVVWEDAGVAPSEHWDMDGAASAAWLEKAGKVAHLYDTKFGDETKSKDQLHAHCMSMAASFVSTTVC